MAIAIVLYAGFPSTVVRVLEWAERRQAGLRLRAVSTADGLVPFLDGGGGPVLLLLHGYQDQKASLVAFAGQLTDRFRVVIPDLHGFGENHAATNGDYRPAAQA
ncbi:MAG: alpha/beta fold hydrolase, partial [Gemmatimonadales bacterium]